MEQKENPLKRVLKPSVIHDDLPEIRKREHSGNASNNEDQLLPENPERNYHHEDASFYEHAGSGIDHADDDEWNGEDA